MFAKRGAALLLRRLQAQAFTGAGTLADNLAWQTVRGSSAVHHGSHAGTFGATARYSTGSFWDMPSSVSREALYVELQTTRGMLPHRGNFSAQFHPHGVQLLPAGLRLRSINLQDAWEDENSSANVPVMADSVKRKRRLKIRKHKFKKRMKKLRHQQ